VEADVEPEREREPGPEPIEAPPPPGPTQPWGPPDPGATAPDLPLAAAAASAHPRESLESRIGARWSVLVGGLALALGAVFLVRYSIEQGLLGPRARVALGFLLSAFLFSAGEVLRRRDRASRAPIFAMRTYPQS
jgi:uncharacterized membrane protein